MQTSEVVTPHAAAEPPTTPSSRLSGWLGKAILVLLGILLVEVLFESWLVIGLRDETGPATWPKTLKSAVYFGLLVIAVAKFTVDRAWRRLGTKADIALIIVGLVMVAAGLAGGSPVTLIAEGLFVYFRGVIVFYAIRSLAPTWREMKPLFWIAGIIVAVNSLVAIWQFIVGQPAYTALGWVNLQWARENRGQGLFVHPNDLGHITSFMLLGLVAWFLTKEKVKAQWWALFALITLGLAVAQSRLSLVALVISIFLIAVVHRKRFKRLLAAGLIVVLLGFSPMVLLKENRDELAYRVNGLINALFVSGGKDSKDKCEDPNSPECDSEIRVLFVKQGSKLWAASPLLGYGVGQFGGIVAVKHDANWNLDPRFQEVLGPEGFYLHDFKSTSVDVFWLHLLVEVGLLGALAYLAWMYFVGAPLVRQTWRLRRSDTGSIYLWSTSLLAFAAFIATWSPSLEDPVFPPLMFGVLGFGWVLLNAAKGEADSVPAAERAE